MSSLPADPNTIRTKAELAEALSNLRIGQSLTIAEMSKRIDVPRSTISGWLRGRAIPYPRQDAAVVELLGLLGIDHPEPWLEALRRARSSQLQYRSINPYKGLEPYTESDAPFFFGRRALVDHIVDRILISATSDSPGTIILNGGRRSGRTSILRAGVIPRIAYRQPEIDIRYSRSSIGPDSSDELSMERGVWLVDDHEPATQGPTGGLKRILSRGHSGLTKVLVTSSMLLEEVLAVQEIDNSGVEVVHIPDLGIEDLSEIIQAPANVAGINVSYELFGRVIHELTQGAGSIVPSERLPLLSHLLYVLTDRAVDPSTLDSDTYDKVGGLGSIVESLADDTLLSLPETTRPAARELFAKLLVDSNGHAMPRRWKSIELLSSDSTTTMEVVEAFVSNGLISVGHEDICFTYPNIVQHWRRLSIWVDDRFYESPHARSVASEASESEPMRTRRVYQLAALTVSISLPFLMLAAQPAFDAGDPLFAAAAAIAAGSLTVVIGLLATKSRSFDRRLDIAKIADLTAAAVQETAVEPDPVGTNVGNRR